LFKNSFLAIRIFWFELYYILDTR